VVDAVTRWEALIVAGVIGLCAAVVWALWRSLP
jgi:hypothetical protein